MLVVESFPCQAAARSENRVEDVVGSSESHKVLSCTCLGVLLESCVVSGERLLLFPGGRCVGMNLGQ